MNDTTAKGTCDCCGKIGILFDRYCAGLHLIVCEKCCHKDSEVLLQQKSPGTGAGAKVGEDDQTHAIG